MAPESRAAKRKRNEAPQADASLADADSRPSKRRGRAAGEQTRRGQQPDAEADTSPRPRRAGVAADESEAKRRLRNGDGGDSPQQKARRDEEADTRPTRASARQKKRQDDQAGADAPTNGIASKKAVRDDAKQARAQKKASDARDAHDAPTRRGHGAGGKKAAQDAEKPPARAQKQRRDAQDAPAALGDGARGKQATQGAKQPSARAQKKQQAVPDAPAGNIRQRASQSSEKPRAHKKRQDATDSKQKKRPSLPAPAPALQDDDAQQGGSPPAASPPRRPYAHLVPRIRRIPQSTITAKWTPLAAPSVTTISTLLELAHAPILQRVAATHQRSLHAAAALRLVTHRVVRKISRGLPFPPAAHAAELDLEAVLDAEAALEAQLQPAVHAVEALQREKERLERELEDDYEALRGLEADARAHARRQREALAKAHPLLPAAPRPDPVVSASSSCGGVFTDLLASNDSLLDPLALQLSEHIDSLSNNLRPTDAIVARLAPARAALQAVLLQHLTPDQYDRVVLS